MFFILSLTTQLMRALRDVAPPDLSSYDDDIARKSAPAIPPRRDPVSMAELIKNSPSRPGSSSSRKSTTQKENEGNNGSEILPGLLWATAATITVCAMIYFVCSSSQDNAASVDALEGDATTTDTAAHAVKDSPPPAVPPAPEAKPAHHSDPLFSPL